MQEFWKKYKEFIALTGYALVLASLFNFGAKPLMKSISERADRIQEEIIDQERRANKLGELSKLREQAGVIKSEEENMRVLISRDQVVALLEEIEKNAQVSGSGVAIEIEEESQPVKKEEQKSGESQKKMIGGLVFNNYIKMKISLSGKYNNCVKFIHKIENTKYWSDIISLKVSGSKPSLQSREEGLSPFQRLAEKKAGETKEKIAENSNVNVVIEMAFYLEE